MNPSFIGITDFANAGQVMCVRDIMDRMQTSRMLAVGLMTSYKVRNGVPTKWENVFPYTRQIQNTFIREPGIFNVLHYADYQGVSKAHDIADALYDSGTNINAIQFDMIWPDHLMIAKAMLDKRLPYNLKVILQVGRKAMEERSNDPEEVADWLEIYEEHGVLDYVLLDRSGGEGRPMVANVLLPYIDAIKDRIPDVGIVLGGGLGPETSQLVELQKIAKIHPDVSSDMQGNLRPSGSALDPIDIDMACEAVRKIAHILK